MTRINIDLLYKMAEEFEEALPPTLPAGQDLAKFQDKPIVPVEESAPQLDARLRFRKEMTARTIMDLIHTFGEIFSLSRGAAGVLRSMDKKLILHPSLGIDAYVGPMNVQMNKINALIGKPKE